MNNNNLSLVAVMTESFDGAPCTLWKDEADEVYMTRESIGQALDYRFPEQAIAKIHSRHADRLDSLSVVVEMVSADGKTYPRYLYSRKGVMEICRWSRKPKADDFMDFAFHIFEQYDKHNLLPRDKVYDMALQLAQDMMRPLQIGSGSTLEAEMDEIKSLMAGIADRLDSRNHLQTIDEMIRCDISNNRIRAALTGMIKHYCEICCVNERTIWMCIYGEFKERFGINVWAEANRLKITPINWVDSVEYLPVLALLAMVMLYGQRGDE